MPMLEVLDKMKENRTGISRSTMGLDANTLSNATEGAFMGAMEQANQRIEMIARTFAETGVKELFLMIHELLIKNYDKEVVTKLSGEYVPVIPTQWKERTNMTVTIGLGTNNKDRKLKQLFTLIEKQEKHLEAGTTLVAPQNVYNAYDDLIQEAGFKSIGRYMIDPTSQEGQQMAQQKQQQSQQPNPQVMAIQAQTQIEQGKAQIATQKQQAEMQMKAKELELKERELAIREQEISLKLEIQANAEVNKLQMHNDKIAVDITKIEADTLTEQNANFLENEAMLNG